MLLRKKSATSFQIELKSIDNKSLSFYTHFLKRVFYKMNATYSHANLPIKKKRITLLKSPHVNKSAREQFELRCYKSVWEIRSKLTYEFAKILFKNKPQTVSVVIKQIGG
jgi:ribosomal protein S10